jgi:LytS/YehU family sensor histidine kinase
VLFPLYSQEKKLIVSAIYGLLICVLGAMIGSVLIALQFGTDRLFGAGIGAFFSMTLTMVSIGLANGIVAVIIKGFITWYEELKLKEVLQAKNHQMELALVKSQLDPHFLFNTINNIDILILKNATLASEYLNKLSDILRFMLFETKTEQIALTKEIEYIEKYIALQKIRTSNANFVNFTVHGNLSNKTIAPMLFIPFIENAFKYVSNKKAEPAITIRITCEEHELRFECENQFGTTTTLSSNGLGNDLIEKRLALLYPKKHTLVLSNQDHIYQVNLVIKK